ncbi:hypothetical protein Tco_0175534 [Tanacetum coccineum]
MHVELGSLDVIIGMDWLSKYHVVIVCYEKIVRIPYGNEILTIQGDRSDSGSNSRLNIISCTKTQKYIQKNAMCFWNTSLTRRRRRSWRRSDLRTTWCYTYDTIALLTSPIGNARVVEPTARAGRQRIYMTKFFTMGSSDLVHQEEGWILQDVHRLQRIEQANREELLSALKDR